MSLFSFLRTSPPKTSAVQARERLQILLAHERSSLSAPDFLPQLQKDLIQVIRKYVQIPDDKVLVKLDRATDVSTLEVNIELPGPPVDSSRGRMRTMAG
ncbi:MAG: cell division topological specificity factor MinE [Pseudomonadota bacterium]|nr:cell division topological specificity factor MinE [Pseudomonadota bacterium]